jgi:hypothetical protein
MLTCEAQEKRIVLSAVPSLQIIAAEHERNGDTWLYGPQEGARNKVIFESVLAEYLMNTHWKDTAAGTRKDRCVSDLLTLQSSSSKDISAHME